MDICIKPNERVEELYDGTRVIQNPDGFCYGTDAVMLSGFVSAKPNEKLLDFCTGTGIIPLCLRLLTRCRDMTALEIQPEVADMAERSMRLNGYESEIKVVCGDLKHAKELFGAESFDVVTCNPPYMKPMSGKENTNDSKTIARHEVLCTLGDVVKSAASVLRTGGRFYMVHRPERLADIFYLMKQEKLEPKRMQFVHSDFSAAPSLVLVEGQKGRKSGLVIVEPTLAKGIDKIIEQAGVNFDD